MEVKIKGLAQEIADFVKAIQSQPLKTNIKIEAKEEFKNAIKKLE
nr:MAG TPA: Fimbrial assembly protein (PilN) [Caudoviricetes sp.]